MLKPRWCPLLAVLLGVWNTAAEAQSVIGQRWDGTTSTLPLNLDDGQRLWDNFFLPGPVGTQVSIGRFAAVTFYSPSTPYNALHIQVFPDSGNGTPRISGPLLFDAIVPTSAMQVTDLGYAEYGASIRAITWNLSEQSAFSLPAGEQLWIRYFAPESARWLGSMRSDEGDGTCFRWYNASAQGWMPYNMVFELSIVPEPCFARLFVLGVAVLLLRGLPKFRRHIGGSISDD